MGNYFSQPWQKKTGDDGFEVQPLESDFQAEKGDVMGRGHGDWSEPAFDPSEIFKPLTDKEEREVNAVLHGSGHRYCWYTMLLFVCNICLTLLTPSSIILISPLPFAVTKS